MSFRLSAVLLLLVVPPSPAAGQGFPPDEAVRRMRLPEGFSARCVAAEPMIRQPVSISFDRRGRLWVLQYLQYPTYAGLKPVKQDQYLRTIWDRVPEPPPRGPKGADKITILFDPDEHGVFRSSKDFVTGLNIASGFCLGHGGVYVAQPPYLLFYPDRDEDDVPDGDPEVLLTGFGMDDTHSLANSLQWGPDGWLYGATGSTSTSRVRNPHHPNDPVVEFQQGIWRFHPTTKKFELFSEGGGNTYGLDFDRYGRAIAGTNWGGFACLHQMQGAYYVKGFAKHGPLHNPHAYGYFEHVPYSGFRGGHVTCGGIVYQADTYPAEYRNQYIAANLLSHCVNWHRLEPVGASFRAAHGGTLLDAQDTWFRPVDCLQGPDGCVYVVDFYDKRAAHLDPIDNWDKSNGRIYRIEYQGGPRYPTLDLRQKSAAELIHLLRHPNVWYRREARLMLAERPDRTVFGALEAWAGCPDDDLALEAVWTLYGCGGADATFLTRLLRHPNEHVRAWAVRLITDHGPARVPTDDWWKKLDPNESSPVVLAQIACSARRVPPGQVPELISYLIARPACRQDPHLPLLIWWAIEDHMSRTRGWQAAERVVQARWSDPFIAGLVEKIARRWAAGDIIGGDPLFEAVFTRPDQFDPSVVLRGLSLGIDARGDRPFPPAVLRAMRQCRQTHPSDPLLTEVLARLGDEDARQSLRERLTDARSAENLRVRAVETLARARDPRLPELLLDLLPTTRSEPLLVAGLAALEAFDRPETAAEILRAYPAWPAAAKRRAVQLLLARPAWARDLLRAWEAGTFPKADLGPDHARAAVTLGDETVTALVEKHFGKLSPATPGEKQARIAWLNTALARHTGADPARGRELFRRLCAACHRLHGEGGSVGPDLTTADRKNRSYLLTHIVDPSGYIRPEYVVQTVLTTDERRLAGIVRDAGDRLELTQFVDNRPVVVTIAKADVAELRPSAVSLMPEKLLDTLTDAEVADLFAYLADDPPPAPPRPPAARRLKIALVSGSFEYKSDETLAALKKHLEARYPVDCVLIAAKAEKDPTFPGLEQILDCDLVVFFTRRLQIEGESLEVVKKYVASKKPIVGIRTASHGFQKWLEMDREVFGGDYRGHYGRPETRVTVREKHKDHPVLAGVSAFRSAGTLYKNPGLAPDVTVLLDGHWEEQTEPVAWVREKDGRRVFYTSLGHPDDFRDPNFLRLLVNGVAWAAGVQWKP